MFSVLKLFEALFPYTPVTFSTPPIPPSTATNLVKNDVLEDREKEKQERQKKIAKTRTDANIVL